MTAEQIHVDVPASERVSAQPPEVATPPIDRDLRDTVADLASGKALELGCGVGHNSLWLAQRGWTVTGVDSSASAISDAHSAAAAAGLRPVFRIADITTWRPVSRFDLVISMFALPARGMGRSRLLETAAAAVAPGGTILISEFDVSLAREGWMEQKYLVSCDEIERYLSGFRITRSSVQLSRHMYGYDERVLPVATVVATRRTDLRSL